MTSLDLRELFPDLADLTEEEIMMIQESHFSELQKNRDSGNYGGSSSSSGGWNSVQVFDSQQAADEALARALANNPDLTDNELSGYHTTSTTYEVGQNAWRNHQGMDEEEALLKAVADSLRVSGHGSSYQGDMGGNATQIMGNDNIDPDNMTYEELNSLGDAMGKESKGVPVDFISQLPIITYKTGGSGGGGGGGKKVSSMSSKKKKMVKEVVKEETPECVICCTEYENGDKLNILPCAHQFHSDCITPWLKDNKHCPICLKEVQQEAQ